jgi:hypothetical protein
MGGREQVLADFRGWGEGVLAAALVLLAGGTARAETCPAVPGWDRPAQVTLETFKAQPVYRNDRTIADLGSVGVLRRQGLTNVQTQFTLTAEVEIAPVGAQSACYRLKNLTARWKITSIEVFIAFEHRPGTCPFGATRDHENQHVMVAQTTYDRNLPQIEAALRDAASRVPPFLTVRNDNIVTNGLVKRIQGEMAPALAAFDADLKRGNAVLDTPESYREVALRCPKW